MKRVYLLGWCFLSMASGLRAQAPDFTALDSYVVQVHAHRDLPDENEEVNSNATGLIIGVEGTTVRVLTARHVIHQASHVSVTFYQDQMHPVDAEVMPRSSSSLDLAVLEMTVNAAQMKIGGASSLSQLHPLEFVAPSTIKPPLHIWAVNADWEPVPNNVVRADYEGNVSEFEYTATSLGLGYSGGPIFNDQGQVVGIHVAESGNMDYKRGQAVKLPNGLETLDALGYGANFWNKLTLAGTAPTHAPQQAVSTEGSRRGSAASVPATTGSRGSNTGSRGSNSVPSGRSGPAFLANGNTPPADNEATAMPPTPAAANVMQIWKCLNNNKLYGLQFTDDRIDILQDSGLVGQLTRKSKDKKFVGKSLLSSCPGHGEIEFDAISDTRIDGKLEMKPQPIQGQQMNCGGVLGIGIARSMIPITFVRVK